jgi:glycerol uptake facilitator-like aquaporin
MNFSILRQFIAELAGTLLLLAIVVGSGVMGETLSGGNNAIALLGNTIATGAGLVILILIFGQISGAHFNPAVTLAFLIRGDISPRRAFLFVGAQIIGAILGVWLAHLMFDVPVLQEGAKARSGIGQVTGEAVATFGLVLTILGCMRFRPEAAPYAVGLFITAGYWFTSSTSFANPAVTIARTMTDSFAGIALADAPAFILTQLSAAAAATLYAKWQFSTTTGAAQ